MVRMWKEGALQLFVTHAPNQHTRGRSIKLRHVLKSTIVSAQLVVYQYILVLLASDLYYYVPANFLKRHIVS